MSYESVSRRQKKTKQNWISPQIVGKKNKKNRRNWDSKQKLPKSMLLKMTHFPTRQIKGKREFTKTYQNE